MPEKRIIGAWNEWGRLRECVIGQVDDCIEAGYIPALVWVSEEGKRGLRKNAGKALKKAYPDIYKRIRHDLDLLAKTLRDNGVKVHRTLPLKNEEEKTFLGNVQVGNMPFDGADFFRVIGTKVILLNSFRMPMRRKRVWPIRRVLEPLIMGSNAEYVATPPPSPHYTKNELYIENGDIMIDGHNVYVGMSGNGSSAAGIAWLKQLLGEEYRVYTVPLKPNLFHLDWVLTLNRPGLLTYCPEALLNELPEPLEKWDKIKIKSSEIAGANNLSIDENTIVVAEHQTRIAKEYQKKGMKVLTLPMQDTIDYGSGPRCLVAVLRRDP